jgi:dTDP-4-dehydrorhamnose reductase
MRGRKERLLITGGSGLLGSNIARLAINNFEVFATYNSHPIQISGCRFVPLDIRGQQQVISLFKEIKPDLVIHTAALIDVDYCEDHAEEAWLTNVEGTENVVLATREVGAKMLYISTDSVFNGKKGMYSEEDVPDPVNIYAKTKLEGEQRVQRWLPDSIIIRTAFYGWSSSNSSRVSLAEWVVNGLREGRTLPMFTDVFFSPIFVDNLVKIIIEMYGKGLSGIYHVAGSERCSKYDFGQEIAQAFGLNKNYIQPTSITEAGLRAPRPRDLSLNTTKVSGLVETRLLGVKEGIAWFKDSEYLAKERQK